jgi:hypothetical protein
MRQATKKNIYLKSDKKPAPKPIVTDAQRILEDMRENLTLHNYQT